MLLLGSASSIASFFSAFAGGMGSRRAAPPRLLAEGRKLLADRNWHQDILPTDRSNDTVAEGKHETRGLTRTWMDQEDFPCTTWPCCPRGALTHCPTLLSLSVRIPSLITARAITGALAPFFFKVRPHFVVAGRFSMFEIVETLNDK